jgi:hypothetical protein
MDNFKMVLMGEDNTYKSSPETIPGLNKYHLKYA